MFKAGSMVAVAGSRQLPGGMPDAVGSVAGALLDAGHSLAVGCCQGADEAVLRAAVARGCGHRLSVLCAFGPSGAGACGLSAVAAVEAAAAAGACVNWWAGGGARVPLRARLAGRTRAVVGAAAGGLMACFGSAESRGSLLACRRAHALGRPVLALPPGGVAEALPVLGPGAWQPVGRLGGVPVMRWCQAQACLL